MTFRSLRKPRTTVRGPIIQAPTAASLAAALTLLLGGLASAEQPITGSDYYSLAVPAALPAAPPPPIPATSSATPTTQPAPMLIKAQRAMPVVSSSTPIQAKWTAPTPPPPAPVRLRTTVATNPSPILPVFYQRNPGGDDTHEEYQVQTEIPGLGRLSRLDSDKKLQERIRQETIDRSPRLQVIFPEEPILSREVYKDRAGQIPSRQMTVEPYYVTYRNLYFQQNNFERFGWDLGPITPLICTGEFFFDVATLPIQFAARPCERDSSTGYCLPGDSVPLLLYPPEVTLSGITLETAAIIALVAIFP